MASEGFGCVNLHRTHFSSEAMACWMPSVLMSSLDLARNTRNGNIAAEARMLLLLLLLLMLPQAACGILQTKCPLNLAADRTDPFNYYKPGDYQISGILSTINAIVLQDVFKQPPSTKLYG